MPSAPLQSTHTAVQPKSLSFDNGFSRADAFAIFAVVCWGVNVAFTKASLGEIHVLALISLRLTLSAVVAVVALVLLERDLHVKRRDLFSLGLLGFIGVGLAQFVFIIGLNLSFATHGALLLGASPVFAALMAGWLGWDQLQKKNWVGVIICLGGLVLLTGIGSAAFNMNIVLGDLVTILSALCGATYTVFSKRFLADYSPLRILTYGLVVSLLPLLVLGGPSILAQNLSRVSIEAYAALGFSAIFGTVIASVLWLKSVTRIGIVRTSVYQYLVPVIGVVVALVLLREELSAMQWVGTAIVLIGIFFARSS